MNGEMQTVMSKATDAFLKEDVPDVQNRQKQVNSPKEFSVLETKRALTALSETISFT